MTPRTKKRRLLRLAKRIASLRRVRFDQANYCGAACCVAGHTILEFGTKIKRVQFAAAAAKPGLQWPFAIHETAAKLLNLNSEDSRMLFAGGWPRRWQTQTHRVTPHLAAKRLRHYAETGSLD